MGKEDTPLICGGVYKQLDLHDVERHGLMVALTINGNEQSGLIYWTGFKPELVTNHNKDRLAKLELIAKPAPLVIEKPEPKPEPKPPVRRAKTSVGRPRKKS